MSYIVFDTGNTLYKGVVYSIALRKYHDAVREANEKGGYKVITLHDTSRSKPDKRVRVAKR